MALGLDADEANRGIVNRQLLVLGETLAEGAQAVADEFLSRAVGKLVDVALEVRPGHLAAGANGKRRHLLRHARGLELEQVGAGLVDAGNEQADAIGALAVDLGVDLGLVANHADEVADGHGAAVGQAVAEALLLHKVGEDAGVGCEAGDGDAGVLVNVEQLLLVR